MHTTPDLRVEFEPNDHFFRLGDLIPLSRVSSFMNRLWITLGGGVAIVVVLTYFVYQIMEAKYQRDMDPIRREHVHHIVGVIQEFAERTGHLPFQQQAEEQPFMVLIGHSPEQEDHFAKAPVLKRDSQWANSSRLESVLTKGLGRDVRLPRDPQKIPTYAPNVYIYFISGKQMTVISHLHNPSEGTVEYEWNGTPFYSYTITYEFNLPSNDPDSE